MIGILKAWCTHATIAAVITLALWPFGWEAYSAAAAVGFYVFREVEQQLWWDPAEGLAPWLKRIGDAAIPAIVAVGLAVLL